MGGEVVIELSPSSDELSSWLVIYPIQSSSLKSLPPPLINEIIRVDNNKSEWAFRIYKFEVPKEYIEMDYDISEEEMTNNKGKIVLNFQALETELCKMDIDTDNLTEPWKTKFPL